MTAELFYDCGAYGLFTLASESWQPAQRGERADPAGFAPDPAAKLFDPVWYNHGPVIRALGGRVHVIDVGGYIGTFTIPMALCAARAKQDLTFDVFEPGATVNVLRKSVAVNGLEDRIKVHHMAVSAQVGEVTFRWCADGQIGGQVFSDANTDRSATVPSTTIDAVCRDHAGPLLIKLDTQGHEHSIMAAARETIAAKKAVWQIEFMAASAKAPFGAGRTFAQFLEDEFVLFDVRKEVPAGRMDALVASLPSRPSQMTDLIMVPKDAPFTAAAVAAMTSRP